MFLRQSAPRRNQAKSSSGRRTLLLETLETRATPAVFAVTNVNDSGDGSLRDAITSANNTPGKDAINFDIPGSGVHRITVVSQLPFLRDSVAIDGWSQPGATFSVPAIEIKGGPSHPEWCFIVMADHNLIRGLTINGFQFGAMDFRGPTSNGSSFNKVQANFLGTNATGTTAISGGTGVFLRSGSHNNIIGTDSDGVSDAIEGNVCASFVGGNTATGMDHNIIAGNVFDRNRIGPITNAVGARISIRGHDNRIGTNHDGFADQWEGNVFAEVPAGYGNSLYIAGDRNSSLGNIISRTDNDLVYAYPMQIASGSNEYATPPILTELTASEGLITVSGIFDSKPNTVYLLEVAASPELEGNYLHTNRSFVQVKEIIGYITIATDANGHANFSKQFEYNLQAGWSIIASATDSVGNTSRFSTAIYEGEFGGAPFHLHSNPTATKRIYLDFNGETVTGTRWNSQFNKPTIVAPPYFTAVDMRDPIEVAHRVFLYFSEVAEEFRPFDVDVTTEEPSPDDLINSGGADDRWGIRVIPTRTNSASLLGSPGNGAVDYPGAFLNSFGDALGTPVFVFLGDGNNGLAFEGWRAATVLVGRSLGLHPDGVDSSQPSSPSYSQASYWQPIMSGGGDISQWSKGQYHDATNFENDLAIITTQNGFGYRNDLVGDTEADAALLNIVNGNVRSDGIIERNTDRDVFAFDAPAGNLDLGIYPDWYAGNLNVLAELLDANGNVIASSNPQGQLDAHITATVPAGRYYLRIDGAGEGDPLTPPYSGFTDYGSLGTYHIRGAVTPTGNVAPVVSGFGGVAQFVEDSPRVALAPAAIVNDANGGDFAGGYVVAKIIQNANYNDRLEIRSDGTGPGQVGLSGNKVLYSGLVIGSFSGGNANQALTVVLNSNATPIRVQALLRNIVFGNIGDTPITTRRVVQFQVADGDGGVSNNVTSYVDVKPHNDSPSLMYFGDNISYKLASTPVAVAPNVSLTDPDSANFGGGRLVMRITEARDASNRLTIGGPFGISGQDVYLGSTKLGRLATADAGIGYSNLVIDLTANATPTNVQQLLRAIRFSTTNASLVAARKVESFVLDGDGGLSTTESKFIFTEK